MIGIASIIMVMVLTITLQPTVRAIRKFFNNEDATLTSSYQFEDFICNDVFSSEKYQAIHLQGQPDTIITAIEKFKLPVLRFKNSANGGQFYVLCSYHEHSDHRQIKWCKKQRLSLFKNITEIPVYVFLGVGGAGHFPDKLYLIPLDDLTTNIDSSLLEKYRFSFGQDINLPD